MGSKDLEELLRSPRGMFHPCLHESFNEDLIGAMRAGMGTS